MNARMFTNVAAMTAVFVAATLVPRVATQDRRLTVSTAAGERRVALVVGNDTYTEAPLRNARNDARAMARALEGVGFQVTLLQDATRQSLTAAIAAFGNRLGPSDIALFYYAGHGVQVDNENYLVPTDFTGASAGEVRLNAVPASTVQRLLEPARIAMLVLDACRNNPFTGARGGTGLASMEARGSLIAFATGAGQTAADAGSTAANGLFTQELVKNLGQPGLTVQDVFRRVRQSVYEASAGRQFPAIYDGLLGEFVFRPGQAGAPSAAVPADPAPPVADSDLARREELTLWDAIKDTRTPSLLEDFLRQFPNGRFRAVAEERLATLRTPAPVPPPPCNESRLRSLLGDTPAALEFVNVSGSARRIYWLDYDGVRKFYANLPPGESLRLDSYLTHPWVAADASDRCVSTFTATATRQRFEVR